MKKDGANKLRPIFENRYIEKLDIDLLYQEIQHELKAISEKDFLENYIKSEKAQTLISDLEDYKNVSAKVRVRYKKNYDNNQESGIYFDLEVYNGTLYSKKLTLDKDNFLEVIESAKQEVDDFTEKYSTAIDLVSKINNCKNAFWEATLAFNCHGVLRLEIDQIYINPSEWHITKEYIDSESLLSSEDQLRNVIVNKMKMVIKNMEKYGYRVMEVRQ